MISEQILIINDLSVWWGREARIFKIPDCRAIALNLILRFFSMAIANARCLYRYTGRKTISYTLC
jgi:hypothetical protein